MEYFNFGGYIQRVSKKGITCTCQWGSLYIENYEKGEQVCKHIKKIIKWKQKQNKKKKVHLDKD